MDNIDGLHKASLHLLDQIRQFRPIFQPLGPRYAQVPLANVDQMVGIAVLSGEILEGILGLDAVDVFSNLLVGRQPLIDEGHLFTSQVDQLFPVGRAVLFGPQPAAKIAVCVGHPVLLLARFAAGGRRFIQHLCQTLRRHG